MSAFTKCKEIEARGLDDLLGFFKSTSFDGRFVLTDKGRLSEFLQREVGDVLITRKTGNTVAVEVKCEEANKTGNFYLETWSNKIIGGRLGWMYTIKADYIFYYFIASKELFIVEFPDLWTWAFERMRLYATEHPERMQKKTKQINETWGRCVPIETIAREVGLTEFRKNDAGEFKMVRKCKPGERPICESLQARQSWKTPPETANLFSGAGAKQ